MNAGCWHTWAASVHFPRLTEAHEQRQEVNQTDSGEQSVPLRVFRVCYKRDWCTSLCFCGPTFPVSLLLLCILLCFMQKTCNSGERGNMELTPWDAPQHPVVIHSDNKCSYGYILDQDRVTGAFHTRGRPFLHIYRPWLVRDGGFKGANHVHWVSPLPGSHVGHVHLICFILWYNSVFVRTEPS